MSTRKPVAMTEDENGGWTVVCDDGTVWFSTHDREKVPGTSFGDLDYTNHRWKQVPHGPIPGTAAALASTGTEG